MAKFHPELDLLTEHAAGNLPLAQAACVSVHLNYCEQCRRASAQLQSLGATLFEGLPGEPVGDTLLNMVLARLDDAPPLSYASSAGWSAGRTPAILQRLMSGDFTDLVWKKITSTLRISYLKTGDPNYEFALYHIKAGGRIYVCTPCMKKRGITEADLVAGATPAGGAALVEWLSAGSPAVAY